MTTETIEFKYDASANIYIRVFNSSGQVLDFSDDTFKALASATTPYLACSETAALFGTGESRYSVGLDLSKLNSTGAENSFTIYAYDNATPADTDNPVSGPIAVDVQFSMPGHKDLVARCEMVLNGADADIQVWLERGGVKVDIDAADAACSCSVTVREHGSGTNLFVKAGVVGDLTNDIFEFTQLTAGFTDDTILEVTATVTENSNNHVTTQSEVAIG